MIKVKIRGPTVLQGVMASMEREYPFGRRALWIGRGQQIQEKQNQSNYVLNVGDISKSISRVHACLLMSPAFWQGYEFTYPSYFKKLSVGISQLPDNILFQIWEFARPGRRILLKDMRSKTGVFKMVRSVAIFAGIQVVLGDSRPLLFHHQQIYNSWEEMRARIDWLKQRQHVILNERGEDRAVHSFWIMSFKAQNYILLDYPCRLTIGRSSGCTLVICQACISRRHATLQFKNGIWRILDGDGSHFSSNGVWQRVKKVELQYRNKEQQMKLGESTVKLGDILFDFQIKEDYSYLNLSEMGLSFKNSNSQSIIQTIKRQIKAAEDMDC